MKNTICTKPARFEGLTLINDKLIEKENEGRTEKPICNDGELRSALRTGFGIVIA